MEENSVEFPRKIKKSTPWRRGVQISEKEEDVVRVSDRCGSKERAWSKY